MRCTGLFDHSIGKLSIVEVTKKEIKKVCTKCGYLETFQRSNNEVIYPSNLLMQKKKWAADDNRKELLQPLKSTGEVNEDFTEAYGYNPFDNRTKDFLPKVQKGKGA